MTFTPMCAHCALEICMHFRKYEYLMRAYLEVLLPQAITTH